MFPFFHGCNGCVNVRSGLLLLQMQRVSEIKRENSHTQLDVAYKSQSCYSIWGRDMGWERKKDTFSPFVPQFNSILLSPPESKGRYCVREVAVIVRVRGLWPTHSLSLLSLILSPMDFGVVWCPLFSLTSFTVFLSFLPSLSFFLTSVLFFSWLPVLVLSLSNLELKMGRDYPRLSLLWLEKKREREAAKGEKKREIIVTTVALPSFFFLSSSVAVVLICD